jgi:hypothetical protein
MTTDDTGDGAGQTDRWLAETREENPFRWVRGSARLASVRPERRTARVDLARLCGKVPTPRGSRCDQSQGNEGGAPRSSCRHHYHILKRMAMSRLTVLLQDGSTMMWSQCRLQGHLAITHRSPVSARSGSRTINSWV